MTIWKTPDPGMSPHFATFLAKSDAVREGFGDTVIEDIRRLIGELRPLRQGSFDEVGEYQRANAGRAHWTYVTEGGDSTGSYASLTRDFGLKHRYRSSDNPEWRHMVEPVAIADLWFPKSRIPSFVVIAQYDPTEVFYVVESAEAVRETATTSRHDCLSHCEQRGVYLENRPHREVYVDFDYLATCSGSLAPDIGRVLRSNGPEFAHRREIRDALLDPERVLNS